MIEGEGFQIVIWDVINKKKAEKAEKEKGKKGEYVNSGQVILKTINLEQVSLNIVLHYISTNIWPNGNYV